MKNLSEEDEEAYKKQFSRSIKLGMTPDSIEGMYTKAHADIRADPSAKVKVDKKVTKKRWTAAKIGLEALLRWKTRRIPSLEVIQKGRIVDGKERRGMI